MERKGRGGGGWSSAEGRDLVTKGEVDPQDEQETALSLGLLFLSRDVANGMAFLTYKGAGRDYLGIIITLHSPRI